MLLAVVGRVLPFLLHVLVFHDSFSALPLARQANKHIHIYAGWFAYVSGLVQCYRGLELVSGSDKLVFSAADMDFSVSLLAHPSVCCMHGCLMRPSHTLGWSARGSNTRRGLGVGGRGKVEVGVETRGESE